MMFVLSSLWLSFHRSLFIVHTARANLSFHPLSRTRQFQQTGFRHLTLLHTHRFHKKIRARAGTEKLDTQNVFGKTKSFRSMPQIFLLLNLFSKNLNERWWVGMQYRPRWTTSFDRTSQEVPLWKTATETGLKVTDRFLEQLYQVEKVLESLCLSPEFNNEQQKLFVVEGKVAWQCKEFFAFVAKILSPNFTASNNRSLAKLNRYQDNSSFAVKGSSVSFASTMEAFTCNTRRVLVKRTCSIGMNNTKIRLHCFNPRMQQ